MKPRIRIDTQGELVAIKLITRVTAVMLAGIVAFTIAGILTTNPIADAILQTLMPIIPLAAVLYIMNMLPREVTVFMKEKFPEHYEYVPIEDLRRELLTRQPGVLIQSDERMQLMKFYDTVSDKADEACFMRFYGAAEQWAHCSTMIGKQRGVL